MPAVTPAPFVIPRSFLPRRLLIRFAAGALTDNECLVIDRWLAGHTWTAIGKDIGITPEAAQMRAHNGMRKMRKRLAAVGIKKAADLL